MCWADKLAIAWFVFVFTAAFLIADVNLFNNLAEALADPALWGGFFGGLFKVFVVPWLFLRFVDWLIGGPARRRASNNPTIILKASETGPVDKEMPWYDPWENQYEAEQRYGPMSPER